MAKTVRYVPTFRAPSEYERQVEEARRRAALAEALAQQQYEPMEGNAAPIPKAAPLVKALQSFMTARAGRQAQEAAEEAKGMEADYAQRMLGRMQGGYTYQPDAELETQMAKRPEETLDQYTQRMQATPFVGRAAPIPEQTELGEVTRQSQYRRAPEEVLGMASTSLGTAALKDRPVMAQRLAQMLETPKEAQPMVTGGMFRDPKTGQWQEIPGYTEQQQSIAEARRPPATPAAAKEERLVAILGADGKPTYVRESEAVGKTPFTAKTLAQETADAAAVQANTQREIDTQSALDNIGELIAHPGRQAATGKSSFVSIVPGTDAYDFNSKLETFKAQTFIPMVSALKGMGALSDADGKKLQAAVGALDPSMSEEAFAKELEKVANTLFAKAKAAGLNVVLPSNMGPVIKLPPRR
jgi:hypothetical protein